MTLASMDTLGCESYAATAATTAAAVDSELTFPLRGVKFCHSSLHAVLSLVFPQGE